MVEIGRRPQYNQAQLGWHAVPTLPKDKGSTWCGPYLEVEPFPIRYPLTAIPFIVAWLRRALLG